MRKELENTYIRQADGGVVVRARTPEGQINERLIESKLLCLDVGYTDEQGTPQIARVNLEPRISKVLRVDNILPSNQHLFFLAAKNCYSGLDDDALISTAKTTSEQELEAFLKSRIVDTKHWSVLEHRGHGSIPVLE